MNPSLGFFNFFNTENGFLTVQLNIIINLIIIYIESNQVVQLAEHSKQWKQTGNGQCPP